MDHDLAALASAFEGVATVSIDVLDIGDRFKECIYRCIPFFA
jgi:hypothetical protein